MERISEQKKADKLAWRVSEFCRAFSISRSGFYVLLNRNKIQTILIGRRRLIPEAEVRRLLLEGILSDNAIQENSQDERLKKDHASSLVRMRSRKLQEDAQ